jgi:hypothetical protein
LKNKIFNAEAKKPFATLSKTTTIPHLLGIVDDVRTFNTKCDEVRKLVNDVRRALDDDEGKRILKNIKILREWFDQDVLGKQTVGSSRPARAA